MHGNIWQVSIYILQAKQFYKVQGVRRISVQGYEILWNLQFWSTVVFYVKRKTNLGLFLNGHSKYILVIPKLKYLSAKYWYNFIND